MDSRVREVLRRAELVHCAVQAAHGPHVTPAAFDWTGGALWLVTTRSSVKARALRRRSRVGALVRSSRYDLVLDGNATLIDPLRARGIADPVTLLELPFAGLGYLERNAGHALAMVRDAAGPGLVLDRLAVRIRPDRAVLLAREPGSGIGAVLSDTGGWTSAELIGSATGKDGVAVPELPPAVAPLLASAGPACLAWPTVHGPMALPAHWCGDGRIEVDADLLALVGARPAGTACLTLSTGKYRLSSKRGVMLRGDATAARASAARAAITLRPTRATYWIGDSTATVTI